MLGDITITEEIYIACGYTDMRKFIDGLAALVQESMGLNPFSPALYLFCRNVGIGLRRCFGKVTVLFCFTNVSKMATTNGPGPKMKFEPCPEKNSGGCWKDFRLINSEPSYRWNPVISVDQKCLKPHNSWFFQRL
jgi:hypothetical protein